MILGFVSILLMGIALGLLGAGGSILTVPILVYLFKASPALSTSYSLLLVGFTALTGAFFYFKKGQIDFNIAIKFGVPSIIAVYLTRRFIFPAIPDKIRIFSSLIEKDLLILLLFAIIMFLAAISMIKSRDDLLQAAKINVKPHIKNTLIVIEALLVGFLTAMVGAGGGFLIIPALVILNKINVKTAIGTSLLIIAAKSLIGFVGDIQTNMNLDYVFASKLIILASSGMFLGVLLSKYCNSDYLKKGFGYFVMIAAILIIVKELTI